MSTNDERVVYMWASMKYGGEWANDQNGRPATWDYDDALLQAGRLAASDEGVIEIWAHTETRVGEAYEDKWYENDDSEFVTAVNRHGDEILNYDPDVDYDDDDDDDDDDDA